MAYKEPRLDRYRYKTLFMDNCEGTLEDVVCEMDDKLDQILAILVKSKKGKGSQ